MNRRPVIGAVSYLNTKPLVAGMQLNAPEYDLRFDLPSRLADQLDQGTIDVGLIPVVEAVSSSKYTIVSDACIACCGPVWSVKLFSRVPPAEISTLSLDEGSRTSCALVKIWLEKNHGVRPACQLLGINDDWQSTKTDAVLIIGDRAMKTPDAGFPYSWDMGQAWFDWTGKPFVFAAWAARPGADFELLSHLLSRSKDAGMATIEKLASENAERYGLSFEESLKYLNEHLHFHLGAEEKSGMALFFQYAAELSLIPNSYHLNFHDFQTTG